MNEKEAYQIFLRWNEFRLSGKWEKHFARLMRAQLKNHGFRIMKGKNGALPVLVREIHG